MLAVVMIGVVAGRLALEGGWRARIAAGGLILFTLVAVVLGELRERRKASDPVHTLRRVGARCDRSIVERAERALSLVPRAADEPSGQVSSVLAELHIERSLGAISRAQVLSACARVAARFNVLALALLVGIVAIVAVDPWAIAEGWNILLARDGTAPFEMTWIPQVGSTVRPPDYLHLDERPTYGASSASVHRGAVITLRGAPSRTGRKLVVTDGVTEVPFDDDGSGRLVARWTVGDSGALRVVARFGDVVIVQPSFLDVKSIADAPPLVVVDGAPREIRLSDASTAGEIPIRYEVRDDHGLREVQLVLRSAGREERRVLSRLDGDTRSDRGGTMLRASDPFIKKSHSTIDVRVEARDNDVVTGPKWGKSFPIIIVPAELGELEALRLDEFRALRDRLVDSLAWRIENGPPASLGARAPWLAEEERGVDDDEALLLNTVSKSVGGLRLKRRLKSLLSRSMHKVRVAFVDEKKLPTEKTHSALVQRSERVVLVVDAALRGLGERDAKAVALQLADVADEFTLGLAQLDRGENKPEITTKLDANENQLAAGGGAMQRLGALGRDIGEIVVAYLARVGRARDESDLMHATLAARDLALRLRTPDPSFGARGRSGSGSGGSGSAGDEASDEGGGEGGEGEESSDTDEAFGEAAGEVDRIAQDHAGNVVRVQNAVRDKDKNVSEHGARERAIADRAKQLNEKLGEDGALPPAAREALEAAEKAAREAARSLDEGKGEQALEQQRQAQQLFEMAKDATVGDSEGEGEKDNTGDLGSPSGHAEIPDEKAHKGPEEFRRRVLKGLSEATSGRIGDAVRRYAEGLLR